MQIVRTRRYWNYSTDSKVLGNNKPAISHDGDRVMLKIATVRGETMQVIIDKAEIAQILERVELT